MTLLVVRQNPICFELTTFRKAAFAGPHAMQVFVFPFAGGSVNALRGLLETLPDTIRVIGVEFPGRGLTAPALPHQDLRTLLAHLACELTPRLSQPTLFLGYSFGGLVAAEVIRILQAGGHTTPSGLICLSSSAPACVVLSEPWDDLTEDELIHKLRTIGGIPDAILANEEWLRLALPAVQADLRCYAQYRHQNKAPLPCPVLAFVGAQDPSVGTRQVEAWQDEVAPCHRDLTATHVLPGGHFCHVGNEATLAARMCDWIRSLEMVPEQLKPEPRATTRFFWRQFLLPGESS